MKVGEGRDKDVEDVGRYGNVRICYLVSVSGAPQGYLLKMDVRLDGTLAVSMDLIYRDRVRGHKRAHEAKSWLV